MKYLFVIMTFALLWACTPATNSPESDNGSDPAAKSNYPASIPLRRQFACLPKEAAFTAAHRGTSKKEDLAENAGGSLRALIEHGVLIAEIDVAGLKDGTHILFHDGVWEEDSTGKGVVAATNWDEAQKFLLKDTDGDFSSDRLIKLEDALQLSKDVLYLEIDFKSSAKYDYVINAIRDADMADKVILIAYNERQARRLAELAPEMLLSLGAGSRADLNALEAVGVKRGNMAIWLGRGPYEAEFVQYLDDEGIPVLAWPEEGERSQAEGPAVLMVTDYAMQKAPIEGLSFEGREAYEACLAEQ